MRAIFGNPTVAERDGFRANLEWLVATDYGLAMIYNNKNTRSYDKSRILKLNQIFEWCVSGENTSCYKSVRDMLYDYESCL